MTRQWTREGALFVTLPLLLSLVQVSGTGSDVAMNSIGENQDSEFRGAKRLDRRQRHSTHCEPRSGSLAGSAATRSRLPTRSVGRSAAVNHSPLHR